MPIKLANVNCKQAQISECRVEFFFLAPLFLKVDHFRPIFTKKLSVCFLSTNNITLEGGGEGQPKSDQM